MPSAPRSAVGLMWPRIAVMIFSFFSRQPFRAFAIKILFLDASGFDQAFGDVRSRERLYVRYMPVSLGKSPKSFVIDVDSFEWIHWIDAVLLINGKTLANAPFRPLLFQKIKEAPVTRNVNVSRSNSCTQQQHDPRLSNGARLAEIDDRCADKMLSTGCPAKALCRPIDKFLRATIKPSGLHRRTRSIERPELLPSAGIATQRPLGDYAPDFLPLNCCRAYLALLVSYPRPSFDLAPLRHVRC